MGATEDEAARRLIAGQKPADIAGRGTRSADVRTSWGALDGAQPGPLAGLKVIDAGTMIAGPFGTTLLADYGASVIKIEKPRVGDPMRQWTPIKDGLSLWWKVTARNKRLITLDLGAAAGRELFLELAGGADIVFE